MKTYKTFLTIKEAHDLLYLPEGKLTVAILRKNFDKTDTPRITKFAEKFFGKKKFKKTDGNEVTLKTIEFNGYEYTSKNDEEFSKVVKGFLKDFKKGTGNIKILDPKMPFGDLAKTDEFGGEEGGEKGKMTTFYKDFKISNNTEFIEFFQALGFMLGSTLKDNEAGFVDKLQKVTITGKGDFDFISPSSSKQHIFVNKRYIRDQGISKIIRSCYSDGLRPAHHPFYIIFSYCCLYQ